MKKLFTLVMALVAMTFCAKAQYLLQEGFEGATLPTGWVTYDQDGDGFGWELEDCQETPHNTPHVGNGCMFSESYDNDGAGALTPNNWLVTPAIAIPAGAAASLTFWEKGQDPSWCAEHFEVYVSTTGNTVANFTGNPVLEGVATADYVQHTIDLSAYAGQTVYVAFVHNEVTDQFVFLLDDVEVLAISGETIFAASSLDFGSINISTPAVLTTAVNGFNLTGAITATTAAPFAVSADGTTFSTTASVPAAGGTLYVQYAPTAAGTDNGTIALTSGSATASIALTGSAFDCGIATIPYFTDFTSALNDCWTIIDVDGNGNGSNGQFSFVPASAYAQYYYSSTDAANDWLISPTFTFTGSEVASFDYSASSSYPEKFQVLALGTDTVALTSVITAAGSATQNLDLTSLSGNYKIGIHCVSDADELYLRITNFSVSSVAEGSLTVVGDTLDFRTIPSGSNSNPQAFVINTTNFNEAATISTVAPFEVSLDGNTFATSVTLPASTAMFTADTIYARFAPTTPGSFNDVITIATTSTNDTIIVLGEAVDCSEGISTFPYVYDFSTGSFPPTCWTVNNEENFDMVEFNDANAQAIIVLDLDRLVTPEIHSNNPLMFSFDHLSYAAATGDAPTASTFRVGYSSTNTDANSFTWLADANVSLNGLATYTTPIPAGTKYVAIDLVTLGTYLFWGILEVADYIIYDNITLTELSEPVMLVNDETMNFGSVIYGNTAVKNTTVTAALLTSPITVAAPANFEVSADGNTFAASATIPAEGGTLYVKYNPTAVGSHSGNVTLTSGSISKTIAVSGSAVDCSVPATLPFYEDFESELTSCWLNLDNDGDGFTWYTTLGSTLSAHDGNGTYASASFDNGTGSVLYPDNWLITPQIVIPAEGASLKWWTAAQDGSYPADHYEVMISTTGTDAANFTSIFEETLTTDEWLERSQSLANYAGQTIRIAFVHDNCSDAFVMKIDDISVTAGVGINEFDNSVTVFPNPATNVLNVTASSNISLVEVYNMMGQKVASFDANDTNTQINASALTNGIYMLRINTENGTVNQKVTIAR